MGRQGGSRVRRGREFVNGLGINAFGLAASLASFAVLAAGCTASRTAVPETSGTSARVQTAKGQPFSAPELGFELDQPEGGEWALATDVTSPEGREIPVVVAHPESGAQIVVQVSRPDSTPETLAHMLKTRLEAELPMQIGDPEQLSMDSGSDAYGFPFSIVGEASGRVAVIQVGDQVILVVASWPENADSDIVDDVDGVVRSVRLPQNSDPVLLRPDKI